MSSRPILKVTAPDPLSEQADTGHLLIGRFPFASFLQVNLQEKLRHAPAGTFLLVDGGGQGR